MKGTKTTLANRKPARTQRCSSQQARSLLKRCSAKSQTKELIYSITSKFLSPPKTCKSATLASATMISDSLLLLLSGLCKLPCTHFELDCSTLVGRKGKERPEATGLFLTPPVPSRLLPTAGTRASRPALQLLTLPRTRLREPSRIKQ